MLSHADFPPFLSSLPHTRATKTSANSKDTLLSKMGNLKPSIIQWGTDPVLRVRSMQVCKLAPSQGGKVSSPFHPKEHISTTGKNYFQFFNLLRVLGNSLKLHQKGLDWILGNIFSQKSLSSTGTGCPKKLTSPEVFKICEDVAHRGMV